MSNGPDTGFNPGISPTNDLTLMDELVMPVIFERQQRMNRITNDLPVLTQRDVAAPQINQTAIGDPGMQLGTIAIADQPQVLTVVPPTQRRRDRALAIASDVNQNVSEVIEQIRQFAQNNFNILQNQAFQVLSQLAFNPLAPGRQAAFNQFVNQVGHILPPEIFWQIPGGIPGGAELINEFIAQGGSVPPPPLGGGGIDGGIIGGGAGEPGVFGQQVGGGLFPGDPAGHPFFGPGGGGPGGVFEPGGVTDPSAGGIVPPSQPPPVVPPGAPPVPPTGPPPVPPTGPQGQPPGIPSPPLGPQPPPTGPEPTCPPPVVNVNCPPPGGDSCPPQIDPTIQVQVSNNLSNLSGELTNLIRQFLQTGHGNEELIEQIESLVSGIDRTLETFTRTTQGGFAELFGTRQEPGTQTPYQPYPNIHNPDCDINAFLSSAPIGDAPSLGDYVAGMIGIGENAPIFQPEIGGIAGEFTGAISEMLQHFVKSFVDANATAVEQLYAAFGCDDPQYIAAMISTAVTGLIDRWLIAGFNDMSLNARYLANLKCPREWIDAEQAMVTFLTGHLNITNYEAIVKANGKCFEPWLAYTQANRTKMTPHEIVTLRRREIIDETTYRNRMNELGYLGGREPGDLFELSNFIPAPTDLIRWMVRDVANEDVAERFDYDDLFPESYIGIVKQLLDYQGVSEEVAKGMWRAHWRLPGFNTAADVYHRTRGLPEDDPLHTTLDDLRTMLRVDDMAPFWVDRVIETTFTIPTRVDDRRMFRLGVIDRDKIKEDFQRRGYKDEDAENLTKFAERDREGFLERSREYKDFVNLELTAGELRRFLNRHSIPEEEQAEILERGRESRRNDTRTACGKMVERRFNHFELTSDQAREELILRGFDMETAEAKLDRWRCIRESAGREFNTGQIGDLYKRGLILAPEAIDRLLELDWDRDDTALWIARWDQDLDRQAEKEREKAAREAAKRLRAQVAQQQRTAKQIEEAQKRAAKAAEAAAKARERRENRLHKAAVDLAAKDGISAEEAVELLRPLWNEIRNVFGLDIDQALRAVEEAVRKRPKEDTVSISDRVFDSARAMELSQMNGSAVAIGDK